MAKSKLDVAIIDWDDENGIFFPINDFFEHQRNGYLYAYKGTPNWGIQRIFLSKKKLTGSEIRETNEQINTEEES